MVENFYTKRGRHRVVEIKYFQDQRILTESFGYDSVGEFCRQLHKFYIKFTGMPNFLWVSLEFFNVKGHKKYQHFGSIFEFYSFYTGILIAGTLVV